MSKVTFKLIDKADFQLCTGRDSKGEFGIIVTKECDEWAYRLFDFIGYETDIKNEYRLEVTDSDYEEAKNTYGNHSFTDCFLRSYEPKMLVHSTTKESYGKITRDGCLKSWNMLSTHSTPPIGQLLGDPPDYSDFVMLSSGGIAPEIVVQSKQNGEIVTNQDAAYTPGVRMYFDAVKIAGDGLIVRDGAHLKVKDKLPLAPYLQIAVTTEILGLPQITTPKIFSEKADEIYLRSRNAEDEL
jgi:hypothetical protein